jgi:single-strand DNA-binding protein
MAFELNKIQIIGRLGRDPEMRHTKQGTAITTFTVAVGGKWTDRDGTERGDETEWFRVDAWGARQGNSDGLAGLCNDYLSKGQQVYVEGRFKTEQWTDRDGNARTTNKIVASNVVFLGSKSERTGSESPPQSSRRNQPRSVESNMSDDGIPF